MKKGFTLLEIIIVVIIIGILVSMAVPKFTKTKEAAIDKEAIANLKLIQAAQKIYKMETGNYLMITEDISQNTTKQINEKLKLSLPTGANRNWDYTTGWGGCAKACRVNGPARSFHLNIIANEPKYYPNECKSGCS